MKQLIYTSKTTPKINLKEIDEILKVAVEKNKEFGISGLLVFDGETFIQCIEGESKNIDQLFENLSKDDRHSDINLLGQKEVDTRDFESWSMGYIKDIEAVKKLIAETYNKDVQWNYDLANELLQKAIKLL